VISFHKIVISSVVDVLVVDVLVVVVVVVVVGNVSLVYTGMVVVVVASLVVLVVVVILVVGSVGAVEVVLSVTKICLVYISASAPSVILACAPMINIADTNRASSAMIVAFFMLFISLLYKWFVCRLRCARPRR